MSLNKGTQEAAMEQSPPSSLSTPDTERVLVGQIATPFGVRGELKVLPLTDDPTFLARLPEVLLIAENNAQQQRRVVSVRHHQDTCLMRFEGISDRDAADTLRGMRVFVRRDQLPTLEADTFYEWQLLGLRVVTESGRDLGVIEKVHFYPANDVYETPLAMVPAIADVIIEVALAQGELRVRDIRGLRKDEM